MRRLLNGESRFGDGSPISQEFVVLDMVRQAMYRAWNQPTDIGIAGLVTKVELTFNSDGSIVSSRLLAGAGSTASWPSTPPHLRNGRSAPPMPPTKTPAGPPTAATSSA